MTPAPAPGAGPRLLLVRLGALGDVVHAIPVAATLRASWPSARIDWLVDPRYADVARLVRGVDQVIPMDPRGPRSAVWRTVRALRATGYDAAFDVQGLIKSAVLTWLSGASRRFGLPDDERREHWAWPFYTDTPSLPPVSHVIERGLALVAAAARDWRGVVPPRVLAAGAPPFPLDVPPSPAAAEVAARHPHGFAVLNPGAGWPNKQWPAERFGRVAVALRAVHGLRSVVSWGPGEQALAERVVEHGQGAATLSPPARIAELFDLLRRARVVVSGDTGPLHVACAVGTPVVALFGPTRAERNGPWAPADRVLSRTDRCTCLYRRQCVRAAACLDDIDEGEVVDAIAARLAAARG